MKFDLYELPSGEIVRVDATASKGAPEITFTLADGRIVPAVRAKLRGPKPAVHQTRAWQLLVKRYRGHAINVVRSRRAGSHLGLRDAVASLTRDLRAGAV